MNFPRLVRKRLSIFSMKRRFLFEKAKCDVFLGKVSWRQCQWRGKRSFQMINIDMVNMNLSYLFSGKNDSNCSELERETRLLQFIEKKRKTFCFFLKFSSKNCASSTSNMSRYWFWSGSKITGCVTRSYRIAVTEFQFRKGRPVETRSSIFFEIRQLKRFGRVQFLFDGMNFLIRRSDVDWIRWFQLRALFFFFNLKFFDKLFERTRNQISKSIFLLENEKRFHRETSVQRHFRSFFKFIKFLVEQLEC